MAAPTVDWEQVARTFVHQLKVAILDALEKDGGSPRSPIELARERGEEVNTLAYHFRGLADEGLIEVAATEPRREAVEHFYRLKVEA